MSDASRVCLLEKSGASDELRVTQTGKSVDKLKHRGSAEIALFGGMWSVKNRLTKVG
jgi:hypothetical protein